MATREEQVAMNSKQLEEICGLIQKSARSQNKYGTVAPTFTRTCVLLWWTL